MSTSTPAASFTLSPRPASHSHQRPQQVSSQGYQYRSDQCLLLKSTSIASHQCLLLWVAVYRFSSMSVFLCICGSMGIDPSRDMSIAVVALYYHMKLYC